MKLSQAIYRLSKLARIMDIDGCEADVEALTIAVDVLSEKLKDEQIDLAVKHVLRPQDKRLCNDAKGLFSKVSGRVNKL